MIEAESLEVDPDPDAPLFTAQQQRYWIYRHRLALAEIPTEFDGKTIDGWKPSNTGAGNMLAAIQRWLSAWPETVRRGAILYGAVGTGKTHLGTAILREMMWAAKTSGRFYAVPSLFKALRATFDKEADISENDLLDDVINVPLLMLDDLGAEKPTDFVRDRLFVILGERHDARRATIITSNVAWPEGLERVVGPRIVSRIAGMCEPFGPFSGPDHRKGK